MQSTIKKLPKGVVEISVEIPAEEIGNELEAAAAAISKERPIDGFRPGKTPYDVVKSRYGEMAIYEAALPQIVKKTYVKAVVDADLRTYGEPAINVAKLVPGNSIAFTATVALVPKIISLPDLKKIAARTEAAAVEEKEVEDALRQLQKMRTKEVRASREARERDKVVVDMDVSLAGVPIEGGQARGHGINLDEKYYVPGLKEHVVGMKEGDKKNFTLKFPAEHFQKNIAGKDVDFAVTLKEVYELDHPALDDEFAKRLGQQSLPQLRDLLRSNLQTEADEKERQRAELEMLDLIVEKSKFEDMPETIVNAEIERMIDELKRGISGRGIDFQTYLKDIKKTMADLSLDFTAPAIKRIRTALLIREIGEREKIEVSDDEVLGEVKKQMGEYKHDAESQAQMRSEEYQDYLRTALRNKKVIEFLRSTIIKKS